LSYGCFGSGSEVRRNAAWGEFVDFGGNINRKDLRAARQMKRGVQLMLRRWQPIQAAKSPMTTWEHSTQTQRAAGERAVWTTIWTMS